LDQVRHAVLERRELPMFPPQARVSESFIKLTQECWEFNPAIRPTASDVLDRLQSISMLPS